MQIVLIRFIVFVEFHPFSEGLVRWKLHAARARLHTSTLVFLADESPDPGYPFGRFSDFVGLAIWRV